MDQNLPIYLQISHYIENEILNGHFISDDKVPSTNEFSKIMNVNPATAGKGLNELVEQGVLYKKRGLGMFVTKEAKEIIVAKRKQQFMEQTLPALLKEANQLGLTQEEIINMIKEA
ncbi:GntR family transcriptional regulator [Aerococcaceae bacterium DSM 111020]|nr:GntR family transcriptional regulator [Aerococcaceae bacterium DSM 111020]